MFITKQTKREYYFIIVLPGSTSLQNNEIGLQLYKFETDTCLLISWKAPFYC